MNAMMLLYLKFLKGVFELNHPRYRLIQHSPRILKFTRVLLTKSQCAFAGSLHANTFSRDVSARKLRSSSLLISCAMSSFSTCQKLLTPSNCSNPQTPFLQLSDLLPKVMHLIFADLTAHVMHSSAHVGSSHIKCSPVLTDNLVPCRRQLQDLTT